MDIFVNTSSAGGSDGKDNSSGTAFPTLAAAIAHLEGGAKAQDTPVDIICSAPDGVADTTQININTLLTSQTGRLVIRPNHGNEGGTVADQRHAGVWNDAIYRLWVDDLSYTIRVGAAGGYVTIQGLQIRNDGAGSYGAVGIATSGVSNCTYEGNILRSDYAGSGADGTLVAIKFMDAVTSGQRVGNNLIYGWNGSAPNFSVGINCYYANGWIYNNTIVGPVNGIRQVDSTVSLKNNLCQCTGLGFNVNGGSWGTCVTNASSDASAPGTGSRTNQTFTFVNAAGKDYHLDAADAGAKGCGTDLSTDPSYAITVDIDGTTRTGTWDIGADQYAAPAPTGGLTPRIILF